MTIDIANTSWEPFTGVGTGGTYNSWQPNGVGIAAGKISFFGKRILRATGTGLHTFVISRDFGLTGSISATYTTNEGMNSAGHFTAVSGTTTFGDGDEAWQTISIDVTSLPTGLGLIELRFTEIGAGNVIHRSNAWVMLDGGGVTPNASFLVGTGADTSLTPTGTGTIGDPYDNFTAATAAMGDSGGVLYLRDTGGFHRDLKRNSGNDWAGCNAENNCARLNPLIITNYPSESPVIDQGNSFSSDVIVEDQKESDGISIGNFANAIWVVGLEITNAIYCGVYVSPGSPALREDCVVFDCEIHGIGIHESIHSNKAGVRADRSRNIIIQNNTIYSIHNTQDGLSNPFNAVPHGLSHGVQAYDSEDISVINCSFDVLYNGVYNKDASSGEVYSGPDVHSNYFDRISSRCITLGIAGNGQPETKEVRAAYNVSANSDLANPTFRFFDTNQTIQDDAQTELLTVYNNTYVGTDEGINLDITKGIDIYNNISDMTGSSILAGRAVAPILMQLGYVDYNCYPNVATFLTHRSTPENLTYNSLAAWQGAFASGETALTQAVDSNSILTAPTYSNAAGGDYRTLTGVHVAGGLNGAAIGIGNALVGNV